MAFDDPNAGFYARNLSLFVLPLLTGYFVWKRRLDPRTLRWLAAAFVAAAVFANVYPFAPTVTASGVNDPATPSCSRRCTCRSRSGWSVGIAYAGGRWGQVSGRMDFIRFSGELFIYYVLIAPRRRRPHGVHGDDLPGHRDQHRALLPVVAAAVRRDGGVVVASWLVEAKQSVIENMAPVLTRLFTPLFAAVLVVFLGTVLWTGRGLDIERELLIAFDLLLVVVLGLLLYSVSARDPQPPPGAFDVVQVVLVVSCAAGRRGRAVGDRRAHLRVRLHPEPRGRAGENVILLVNLVWSAVLYSRFLRRRGSFADLERWQTNYLPVYAVWAAIVVIVFPPVFGYI